MTSSYTSLNTYVDSVESVTYIEAVEDDAVAGLIAFDVLTTTAQVFEIITEGPPGAQGPAATVYVIRIAVVGNTFYIGRAQVGTSEAAEGWTIKRRTFNATGVLQATATATGAWSNRASLSYS